MRTLSAAKQILIKHMAEVHQNFQPFKCDYCDSFFGQNQRLREHCQKVHQNKMPYKCLLHLCDWSFPSDTQLKHHISDMHNINKVTSII